MASNFREYLPSKELSNYIDCVWFEDFTQLDENVGKSHLVVPDNTVELVFTVNGFNRTTEKEEVKISSHLSGLKTKPQKVEVLGKTLTAVRFKPQGIYPFLDGDVSDTVNQAIDAECLFGKQVNQVLETLINKGTELEKVEFLEAFFLKQLNLSKKKPDPYFEYVIQRIDHSKGQVPLKKLSQELNVSLKTIQRKFLKYIGVTPKKYSRLIRLIDSIKLLEARQVKSFSHLAYNCGYSDQMHFVKEVKEFTGKTPTEFFGQDRGLQKPVFTL